jgi:hypothetical protein
MSSSESSSQNSSAPQSFLLECCLFVLLSAIAWLVAANHINALRHIPYDGVRQLSGLNLSLGIVFSSHIIMHCLRGRRIVRLRTRIKATVIAIITLMAFPIGCKVWLPVFQTQAVEIAILLGTTTLILLYRDTLSTATKKLVAAFLVIAVIYTVASLVLPVTLYAYMNSYVIYKYRRSNPVNNHCSKKLALVNLACSPIPFLVLLSCSIGPFVAYPEFVPLLTSAWLLAMAMGFITAQIHPRNFHIDEITVGLQRFKDLRPQMKIVDWALFLLQGMVMSQILLPWFLIGGNEISYNRLASDSSARIQALEQMIPVKSCNQKYYFLDNSRIGCSDDDYQIYNLESGEMYNANESDRAKLTALQREHNPVRDPRLPIVAPTFESPNRQFHLTTKLDNRYMCCLIATSSGTVLLQFPDELQVSSPQFSPDSRRLAYLVFSNGNYKLYIWNLASLSR